MLYRHQIRFVIIFSYGTHTMFVLFFILNTKEYPLIRLHINGFQYNNETIDVKKVPTADSEVGS